MPLRDLFDQKLKVINVGLPKFALQLKEQDVPTVHVDWRPPAGGRKKTQNLLDRIRSGSEQ